MAMTIDGKKAKQIDAFKKPRTEFVGIRLTESERKRLVKAAEKKKQTISEFVKQSLGISDDFIKKACAL